MQQLSLSPKRIVLGIAFITTGLILLVVVPHPLSYQAPFDVVIISVSIMLACSLTITFGAWLLTGSRVKMFIWPLIIIILWTYGLLMPVLLLPLAQEVLPIVIGFSSLIPVVLYFLYVKLKQKHAKDIKREQK